jgi:hypothetical protein
MCPQWPLVVTTAIFQLPSNGAAVAGVAKQVIAKTADRAAAPIRLPIMKVLIVALS